VSTLTASATPSDSATQPTSATTETVPNRLGLPEEKARPVRWWLWTGVALVFVMVVIGGITRLTQSGLSMVEWDPIMGAIPPLTQADWQATFQKYQQFPEYQQLNHGMSLGEFKSIFFWEYLHRMIGRFIGIVFILPYLFFTFKGYFNRKMRNRAIVLLMLGASQGLMGWFMVMSGLVDKPYVSHFRLAAHLILAFTIAAFTMWYALDLTALRKDRLLADAKRGTEQKWIWGIGGLLFLQILWGAFVAGLDAGLIFNTFPKMNGEWLPEQLLWIKPIWVNFFENPSAVQFSHRVLGTVLGISILVYAGRWLYSSAKSVQIPPLYRKLLAGMAAIVAVQYLLGIFTLLMHVPVVLGVTHQAVAMILWLLWVGVMHYINRSDNHLTAQAYQQN
jgi:cytochrome c oxidase assembly protein subunit 15